MTQESFRENSMKELGRLEGQLAGLRQELAALALKQSSVADQVGLLPQQLQAVRDDVSPNRPGPPLNPRPLRPSVRGVCRGQFPAPAASVPRALALDLTQMLSSCVGSQGWVMHGSHLCGPSRHMLALPQACTPSLLLSPARLGPASIPV